MTTDRDKALQVLRDADSGEDPTELPPTYDHEASRTQFGQLTGNLYAAFGHPCILSTPSQDTALYDSLGIPPEATGAADAVWVLVSNFAPLAMYHLGQVNPGAATDPNDALTPEVRDRIDRALTQAGYFVVPNSMLWEPYDGPHERLRGASFSRFTRFFDYH